MPMHGTITELSTPEQGQLFLIMAILQTQQQFQGLQIFTISV